jgi:N-acyl-D-amino-acid deacylase
MFPRLLPGDRRSAVLPLSRFQKFAPSHFLGIALLLLCGCAPAPVQETGERYDVLIRNGVVYDGSGGPGRRADVGIRGDRVAALTDPGIASGAIEIDAAGQAVAPGFINVLSWANESLIIDGRGMSDVKQGVTLEIFGEGESGGPLNEAMKADLRKRQRDYTYDIDWTTLGGYLESLERRGVSPNVASFVGATTVRIHELGEIDRAPNAEELARMQQLVREAMREGALGVGSSLIYAPAFFAETPELMALARAAGESGGGYVSHIRSESHALEEAIDEFIRITQAGGGHGEIYHLKAAGEANWPKMREAIAQIERARAAALPVTANMYTYTAGATGLDAAMPLWVQEGGLDAWVARLKDPEMRARVIADMRNPPVGEENLYLLAGGTDRVKFIGFKDPKLKPLTGKTLAEVMAMRGTSAEDTIIDLVIEDHSRVDTVYFLMSEDNVRLGIAQPWVSFGSDAQASAPEGVFLKSSNHPRAYGNFARLLGRYVREEKVIPLEEAIRRLTRLPATNWRLHGRGCIDPGCFADVVVFDPATVSDHATFDAPQRYATGVSYVFVNGVAVLRNGEHTGATPGRVVRGPGWDGKTTASRLRTGPPDQD